MRDAGQSRERLERDTEQAAKPCFLLMLLRMPEAAWTMLSIADAFRRLIWFGALCVGPSCLTRCARVQSRTRRDWLLRRVKD